MTATNRFFDSTGLSATSGTVAKASTINAILSEANTAFELVESELSGLGLGEALSNAWASNLPGDEIDPINYPGIYSSLAYAAEARAFAEGTGGVDTLADGVTLLTYSAKEYMEQSEAARDISVAASATVDDQTALANEWAENPEDVAVTGYPGEYSALHHSAKATLAQTAAETAQGLSETAQGLSEDARDLSQQWAAETEDVIVSGGLYSSLHYSAKSEDFSIASAASASDALTSEGLANEWAENPEDTAITGAPGEYSALHWAAKAETTAAGIQDIADDAALAHEWAENPEDVAVTGYPGQYSALHHSAKSEDFAIASSTSESNAAGSATLSQQWAAEAEDVIVSGGLYSSLHYSAKSADSATAAQTAQGLAETAQGLAETAKTDAETAETGAQTAQGLAETAQGLAETARTGAETAQGLAETAQTGAETAETNAETAQGLAETAQGLAETAKTGAETAQGLAETAQANTEAVYDSFDDRYLGPKASDPTVDNDGDTLVAGALYFNTGTELMMVWTGSTWVATYADFGSALTAADIQDTPVDGTIDKCISSNWAYDIQNAQTPFAGISVTSGGYIKEDTGVAGDAYLRMTNGNFDVVLGEYLNANDKFTVNDNDYVTLFSVNSMGGTFLHLKDNAGTYKFSIEDSAYTEIFSVDSNGDVTASGNLDMTGGSIVDLGGITAQAGGDLIVKLGSTSGGFNSLIFRDSDDIEIGWLGDEGNLQIDGYIDIGAGIKWGSTQWVDTTGDFKITLGDAVGADSLIVADNALATVFSVDSDGNVALSGDLDMGGNSIIVGGTSTSDLTIKYSDDLGDSQVRYENNSGQPVTIMDARGAFLQYWKQDSATNSVYNTNSDKIWSLNNDGTIELFNQTGGVTPTASAYELYVDNGVWKINTNGVERAIGSTLLTSTDDLDNFNALALSGTYHWVGTSVPANSPFTSSYATMINTMDGTDGFQMVMGVTGGQKRIYMRERTFATGWGSWVAFLKDNDVSSTPTDSATTTPISSDWAYDHTASMAHPQYLAIACSDETSDLEVADNVVSFRAPHAMTLTGVRASVTTAPTGAGITIDITEGGTTIFSTLLTIDASSKTSVGATTPAVISDTAIADDAEISINIDGVGSTVAGAGLKVVFYYTVG